MKKVFAMATLLAVITADAMVRTEVHYSRYSDPKTGSHYARVEEQINGGTYTDIVGAFVILDEVEDMGIKYPVVAIGSSAFAESSITFVQIGNTPTEIGGRAFYGCKKLASAVIGDGVKEIYDAAFQNCTELQSVVIGSGLKELYSRVFSGCSKLTSIKFKGNKPTAAGADNFLLGVTATVYYPEDDETWTDLSETWGGATKLTFVPLSMNPTTLSALQDRINFAAPGECIKLATSGTFSDSSFTLEIPDEALVSIDMNGKTVTCKLVSVLGNVSLRGTEGKILAPIEVGSAGRISTPWLQTGVTCQQSLIPVVPTEVDVSTAVPVAAMMAGQKVLTFDEYDALCAKYSVVSKSEPQIVASDEVAVKKTVIQAAKAEIVNIANGMAYLGVSVCSNADITASTAWAPVKFTPDTQIGLSADGTKLILPIPVAAQQGFMILQSGDAKVSEGGARVPVTGEPWYKPTVED